MDLPAALQRLANYRLRNSRASRDIFESGVLVLRKNALSKLGDDRTFAHTLARRNVHRVSIGWVFLEQLALASIDIGRLEVAETCYGELTTKFPGSPRVECLKGILIEVKGTDEDALAFYEKLLAADESNGAAWKRKISVLRRTGKVDQAVEELSVFLDTFYTDVEGWLELADIYASCHQYTSSLQSLSQALLLAPQNPFYVLQAAETAYTAGDVPLAIKLFLVVVDMTDGDDDVLVKDSIPSGITVRAWNGVQTCAQRLQKEPKLSLSSASNTSSPQKLSVLEQLAKDMLRKARS
ncbi:TPR-like protein [Auriscalpium vulgare]|uniref:TPR-like protein n=1 Tax=Auriscalpium vulgare TaxID=40419 RepID=A0ACB8RSH1_9AGAM|nr:TPR-like protein [Auriscalpium vulgare]